MTQPPSAKTSIVLRHVRPSDLALLKGWDAKQHMLAANPNDAWDWENELKHCRPWCEQLIAELDGRPIGFIQILDPAQDENRYWGDAGNNLRAIDIWIGEEDCLGKGWGSKMMKLALERCFADPSVEEVLVDPLAGNKRARNFYRRLGFELIELRTFGKDHCAVLSLTKEKFGASQANQQGV